MGPKPWLVYEASWVTGNDTEEAALVLKTCHKIPLKIHKL